MIKDHNNHKSEVVQKKLYIYEILHKHLYTELEIMIHILKMFSIGMIHWPIFGPNFLALKKKKQIKQTQTCMKESNNLSYCLGLKRSTSKKRTNYPEV